MTFSIFPKTIYRTTSPISGDILVKEQLGSLTLEVQGIIQSGGIVKGIWEKALKKVRSTKSIPKESREAGEVRSVLILGLGGGTVVQLIKSKWSEAEITAIEIDPEIIKIGKRFFNLNRFKDLKIVNADAIEFVGVCVDVSIHEYKNALGTTPRKFDLIIVDLYLGKKFLKKAESEKFLKNVKRLLVPDGVAIFNRLRNDKKENFENQLRGNFSQVDLAKTSTNFFFLVKS